MLLKKLAKRSDNLAASTISQLQMQRDHPNDLKDWEALLAQDMSTLSLLEQNKPAKEKARGGAAGQEMNVFRNHDGSVPNLPVTA